MERDFLICFTALFVALDVIGITPMYVGLTRGLPVAQRKHTLNVSMCVALGVALAFVFFGRQLFQYLGIEVHDFKIAGGLILLLVSLADLLGHPESQDRASGSSGIVPIAVPLITGPGVLTTLILQESTYGYTLTVASLVANYIIGWFFLRHSDQVTKILGKDGTVVTSKIAALLLTAISVAMIRSGIFEAISKIPK